MSAWIKPDAASLTGNRFFFGQSASGIHNGMRGSGTLHQAHWGNDHSANTVLNNTDWVHATFVYDGDADLGTIYLNGTADSAATAKQSPNGSGNLIIGGRSGDANAGGGVDWYNGLIDDVAIWDSILTEAQIQELANGVNPFSPVTGVDNENDGAGDGMDDGWEVANGLDPTVDDSAENPDNDGLTNLEEFNNNDNSTDPLDADSDDDDLNDGDEVNTHSTNPNDADSDDDGLNDGAEIAANTLPLDPDSDDDMMGDGYEVDHNHDPLLAADAAQDADNDGSLNVEEYQRGTDPNEQDTDMDGLFDGLEDGSGTFVSAMMTGTDPLVPDTDGDGLADGVEDNGGTFVSASQTGSDPNDDDTDGDIQTDGFEVANSTDPNDPESKSDVATISIIAGLLTGDLTDPEEDGLDGDTILADGDTPQTAGTNFNWTSITASSEEYFGDFGGSEGSFDVFDNLTGGGQNKVCCNSAPQDITVGFEEPISLTHFTLTSSNDTPARDPLDFAIQGSNDGLNYENIYVRQDDTSLWTARNQTVRIDLPAASDSYLFIRYDVTRTGGANHALSEIEYFGEVGASAPLIITSFSYDPDTGVISMTWNSRKNRSYSVFSSTDLIDFGNEINDSVISEGDSTNFTFQAFGPDLDALFFRVVENE